MSKVTTMEELFIEELRDLYDAETQLTKALPKMSKAAASDELRDAFDEHLGETENQVERLESEFFELVGEKPTGKKCAAMTGLIQGEGDEMVSDSEETAVRDCRPHHGCPEGGALRDFSGYGSARTHAELLGNIEAARLLQETLQEEKNADDKLNLLAEGMINLEAVEVTVSMAESRITPRASETAKSRRGR